MAVVNIDGRTLKTERDLHLLLSAALDFGPYYGHNLNALWDSLSTTERPILLIWNYSLVSKSQLGSDTFGAVMELFQSLKDLDEQHGRAERFDYELR